MAKLIYKHPAPWFVLGVIVFLAIVVPLGVAAERREADETSTTTYAVIMTTQEESTDIANIAQTIIDGAVGRRAMPANS